jgi:hypothetical protein
MTGEGEGGWGEVGGASYTGTQTTTYYGQGQEYVHAYVYVARTTGCYVGRAWDRRAGVQRRTTEKQWSTQSR